MSSELTKVQRQILRSIVEAQRLSDRAKCVIWYDDMVVNPDRTPVCKAYKSKLTHIVRAIKMLNKTPRFGVSYYVSEDYDQNGYPSVIVYFRICRPEGHFQISFHTPLRKAGSLMPYVGKGSTTRWNKVLGGSRNDAHQLKEIFDL